VQKTRVVPVKKKYKYAYRKRVEDFFSCSSSPRIVVVVVVLEGI
jgi:hypothetical protein